ncbi:bifunctional phosphoglucose/phosphomannose isomerase [Sulfodiicoccus acidiphilus]|uniref:bifunctional phosphoglucose/phosphomannose isomerase n=1 Tax=Sulfodiicoccus acidiphilus TaxID=1670455 RepID=UPI0013151D6F|nr:bifunctional phosphoglucose/phosphomannose isomerase [Sulfodiicoccus acidiphilus]
MRKAEEVQIPSVRAKPLTLYVGLGGSGIAGDMLAGLGLPVVVWRQPNYPTWLKEATLVAVSYSGETSETLQVVSGALEAGAQIIALTSGGRVEKLSKERNIPLIKVPSGLPPRLAFPYLLIPLLRLLNESYSAGIRVEDFREGAERTKEENFRRAKEVATSIYGKIPVIYGSKFLAIAKRMKQQINENAKYPAFYGEVPEIHHNEVEGYARAFPLQPVLIKGGTADEVTAKLLNPIVLEPPTGTLLQQFGALTHLVDLISLYLAEILKEDPYTLWVIPKARELTASLFR